VQRNLIEDEMKDCSTLTEKEDTIFFFLKYFKMFHFFQKIIKMYIWNF